MVRAFTDQKIRADP